MTRQTFGLVADRPAHKIALMVDVQFAADMLAVGFNGFKAEIQGQGHARGAGSGPDNGHFTTTCALISIIHRSGHRVTGSPQG